MPALQRAKLAPQAQEGLTFVSVAQPKQMRETRVEGDLGVDEIAREIVAWVRGA